MVYLLVYIITINLFMNSPKNESQMKRERENILLGNSGVDKKVDQQMFLQIELLIQQQYQVFVPALVFEYRPLKGAFREFSGWDYDDLAEFFSHFGETELLEIYGKVSIILFKTFIDAYTSKEFLQNSSNFKEAERDNFVVRWYNQEDETIISDLMKSKLKRHNSNQVVDNICSSTNWNNTIGNKNYSNGMNYNNYYNSFNPSSQSEYLGTNFNGQYNYYASMSLNPKAREEFNSVLNSGAQSQGSSSYHGGNYYQYDEDSKSHGHSDKFLVNGKYTCKFEIQIDNDNEFQVARRLIGAKGCNMKKIVELCSRDRDGKFIPDAVKLRLRGRGSGYKEGPYNRESEEPLHLCISSKFQDKYKRACILVQELIINVYEEFKRFCDRNGKVPSSNLTIQKEESVSSRRNAGSNLNPLIKDGNLFVDN